MLARALIATLAAGLIATSDAAAETQFSADEASGVTATPGWVSWQRDYTQDGEWRSQWVLRHGGSVVPLSQAFARTLGTDAKGRAVALDSPCNLCRVVERRLSDGSVRQLPRRAVGAADESGGTLAYVRRGLGIYVLRRGARHVMRVSRVDTWRIALGPRWLVYWDGGAGSDQYSIGAIDLKRAKPRARLIATYSSAEEDCRCTDSFRRESLPTIDGHFAYWVELVVTGREGDSPPGRSTTLLRVDLAAKHPVVEAFSPANEVNDFAVAHGTIYYAATSWFDSSPGVFRVSAPKWEKTARRFPVRS